MRSLFSPKTASRPPTLLGLPRWLAQSSPVSFSLLTMAVCSAPAYAGHWVLTTTGSGEADVNGTAHIENFTAPPPATNSVSISGLSAGEGVGPVFGGGTPPTIKAKANLSITVTGKWTPDGQSDDTAPPTIVFSVSSTANANYNNNGGAIQAGAANDGFGDGAPAGSPVGTSATSSAKYLPGSSTFTVKLALSASASGSPGSTGGGSAGASVGPITIAVHAQPYNFRSSSYTDIHGIFHPAVVKDNPNATLSLSYVWSSTDGVPSDLAGCNINENVTWDTNTVGSYGTSATGQKAYGPPSPPVGTNSQGQPLGYADPTIMGGPATALGATDTFSPDASYIGPYTATSWWGDQVYVFSDSATGETATPLPGPASGSFRITRTVAPTGTPSGKTGTLTTSTRGNSAGPMTLN